MAERRKITLDLPWRPARAGRKREREREREGGRECGSGREKVRKRGGTCHKDKPGLHQKVTRGNLDSWREQEDKAGPATMTSRAVESGRGEWNRAKTAGGGVDVKNRF